MTWPLACGGVEASILLARNTMRTNRLRVAFSLACIIILVQGCALYNTTQFAEYRGPSEFQGQGGTVRSVDGIDVWETGTPNRKFRLLGMIEQSHYDNSSLMSLIARASMDSELMEQVKAHGGDAIIILDSNSAITGYTTHANVSGSQSGTLSGVGSVGLYSGTHSGSGTAYTHANTKTNKAIAVIKYLD